MPDPEDDKPSKEGEVRAHYIQHDDIQNPDVDPSIIYKDDIDAHKGVGFAGGHFGDTVVIPVTFNWNENELGRVPGETARAIQSGEQDINTLVLSEHQQSLALESLQHVAEQSGANIKFVVMDELPNNKGIRFGQYNTGGSIMSTSIEDRSHDENLHDGHVYDVTKGEYYTIAANPFNLKSLNDTQATYSYMHEICHALGFDHPNDGLNVKHVEWGETVMRTQQGASDQFIKNPPLQLGDIDVEALQQLYGVNNGQGGKMVDMRGQSESAVARELHSGGYDPELERAYNERVMNEAGVQRQGTSNTDYLKGTEFNDRFTGNEGDDTFYIDAGHDTITDFKAEGDYDWYDAITGTEEDMIVAPEGAVSATIIQQLDSTVVITFENDQGAMPGVSVQLTDFSGDLTDIDILTQEDGRRGSEIDTYHYDEQTSTLGSNDITEPGQISPALDEHRILNLASDFSSAAVDSSQPQEAPQPISNDAVFSAFKV